MNRQLSRTAGRRGWGTSPAQPSPAQPTHQGRLTEEKECRERGRSAVLCYACRRGKLSAPSRGQTVQAVPLRDSLDKPIAPKSPSMVGLVVGGVGRFPFSSSSSHPSIHPLSTFLQYGTLAVLSMSPPPSPSHIFGRKSFGALGHHLPGQASRRVQLGGSPDFPCG